MKNEDIYKKEILELLRDEVFTESDDSNTKQLFGKLFLALNEEIDGDSLIKNILGDE